MESRIIFKLAYIYYMNLDADEIEYLLEKTGLSKEELQKEIISIRDILSDKEIQSLQSEETK